MPEKSDRLTFSPHERFLAITPSDKRAEFRGIVSCPLIEGAMLYAYAQLASNGASREELNGALKFVSIFQNFSEPAEKAQTLPKKNLQTL